MTNTISNDGRYLRNENHPPATWTCMTCWALVMTGNRKQHSARHDKAEGFGS